jgi:hypothetical protein
MLHGLDLLLLTPFHSITKIDNRLMVFTIILFLVVRNDFMVGLMSCHISQLKTSFYYL